MILVDEILEMLDEKKTLKVQKRGLELARKVENFQIFLRPYSNECYGSSWENCALILSEKSDKELEPYLWQLFEWIEYLSTLGASTILERLKRMEKTDVFLKELEKAKSLAELDSECSWKNNLELLG